MKFILFLILISGCASKIDLKEKYAVKNKIQTLSVPFIAQKKFQGGPASLAMMMGYRGRKVLAEKLASESFTSSENENYQSEMVATVRRYGFLPLPVNDIKKLIQELDAKNPVLILQNSGFSWFSRWHYAVVTGLDLETEEVILHSEERKNSRLGIKALEDSWKKSNYWGMVIMKPGNLSATATEAEALEATVSLEVLQKLKEARASYGAILKKWPSSLGALIGLGNVHYSVKDYKHAYYALKEATQKYPWSAMAWHNYAWVLRALDLNESAWAAANRALSLPEEELLPEHRDNLNELIMMKTQ